MRKMKTSQKIVLAFIICLSMYGATSLFSATVEAGWWDNFIEWITGIESDVATLETRLNETDDLLNETIYVIKYNETLGVHHHSKEVITLYPFDLDNFAKWIQKEISGHGREYVFYKFWDWTNYTFNEYCLFEYSEFEMRSSEQDLESLIEMLDLLHFHHIPTDLEWNYIIEILENGYDQDFQHWLDEQEG